MAHKHTLKFAVAALLVTLLMFALFLAPRVGLAKSEKTKDLGLQLQVQSSAQHVDTIPILATVESRVESVTFRASKDDCSYELGTVSAAPYAVQWSPRDLRCGPGLYQVSASAQHVSGKIESQQLPLQLTIKYRALAPQAQGTVQYGVSTSADQYPPVAGTAVDQNVRVITMPAAVAYEKIVIDAAAVMVKESGGEFDGEFRIFDALSKRALDSAIARNPTTAQTARVHAELTPQAGNVHDLYFQFRSTQLFSAVRLVSYDITVQRFVPE